MNLLKLARSVNKAKFLMNKMEVRQVMAKYIDRHGDSWWEAEICRILYIIGARKQRKTALEKRKKMKRTNR